MGRALGASLPGERCRARHIRRPPGPPDRRPVRAIALADSGRPPSARGASPQRRPDPRLLVDIRRPPLNDAAVGARRMATALQRSDAGSVLVVFGPSDRGDRRDLGRTTRTSWLRIVLPALTVLALVPNVALAEWAGPGARTLFAVAPPTIPRLFTGNGYRTCLRRNEIVLALPFGARGNSLIWQAKSGFWFRLAGGYVVNTVPPFFQRPPAVAAVASNDLPKRITVEDIRAFARAASVTTILLDAAQSGPWRKKLDQLGPPHAVDGVLIYSLPRPRPARYGLLRTCG